MTSQTASDCDIGPKRTRDWLYIGASVITLVLLVWSTWLYWLADSPFMGIGSRDDLSPRADQALVILVAAGLPLIGPTWGYWDLRHKGIRSLPYWFSHPITVIAWVVMPFMFGFALADTFHLSTRAIVWIGWPLFALLFAVPLAKQLSNLRRESENSQNSNEGLKTKC